MVHQILPILYEIFLPLRIGVSRETSLLTGWLIRYLDSRQCIQHFPGPKHVHGIWMPIFL